MSFSAYLEGFPGIWKALTAAALLTAALLKFTSLVPPWPDEGGVGASALATTACIAGVVAAYLLPLARARGRRLVGLAATLVALVLLVLYIHLLSVRVIPIEQQIGNVRVERRIVVGTEVRRPADANKTPRELLEHYGLDASAWTPASVASARFGLLVTYMAFYFTFTLAVGITQRRA